MSQQVSLYNIFFIIIIYVYKYIKIDYKNQIKRIEIVTNKNVKKKEMIEKIQKISYSRFLHLPHYRPSNESD